MEVKAVIAALSSELKGLRYEMYICGGAALNLMGFFSRETADIDVLSPPLDEALKGAARTVGERFGLSDKWLNNGPADLLRYLEEGWQERALIVFQSETLTVYSLSRQELLNSKLWASCDRLHDIPDVVAMVPTREELEVAKQWVLRCDAAEIWPEIVDECLRLVSERINE